MSAFFTERFSHLVPYVPGEQPKDRKYVKLNTNESPFPPSPLAAELAAKAANGVELYSDPECRDLVAASCEALGVTKDRILFTNGSDEALYYAFSAWCDEDTPAVFADITYGFYPVFADIVRVPYTEIPLKDDFSIDPDDYINARGTVFIANPNAPTGIALPVSDIEKIVKSDPSRVVVVDEAYVDFGAESAMPLTEKYKNLLVVQTFSKSRSLAGARLGFAVGDPALISDLNTLKYSTNPYNVNSMTAAAGIGALKDTEYMKKNCMTVAENREKTTASLRAMGFETTDSKSNFIFARHSDIGGGELYEKLRERGILIRHFTKERICEYNRITVGTMDQMNIFLSAVSDILEGK